MRGVTLFSTTVALAVPAILWPPRPVRAETLDAVPVAMVMDEGSLAVSGSR
jgi:hypothetical protein